MRNGMSAVTSSVAVSTIETESLVEFDTKTRESVAYIKAMAEAGCE